MGYRLREGISFCRVIDRFVFLDVPEDRYFCLPEAADRAFADLVSAAYSSATSLAALDTLRSKGLLLETREPSRPEPCRGTEMPVATLLQGKQRMSPLNVARALVRRQMVSRELKRRRFSEILIDIAARKACLPKLAAGLVDLEPVIGGFRNAALLVSTHDRCLATSIAVIRELLSRGVRAELVLGVRLRPFQAHCWVQRGDLVVNDQVDTVAMFTPILVT